MLGLESTERTLPGWKRGCRELLHHGKQQLAVALIQIRRIAANLGEEPEFLVRELLGVELAAEGVVGKKLSDGQIEGLGNL